MQFILYAVSTAYYQLATSCSCFTFFLDSDGYEFTIVSLDNKQWQFEAQTQEV